MLENSAEEVGDLHIVSDAIFIEYDKENVADNNGDDDFVRKLNDVRSLQNETATKQSEMIQKINVKKSMILDTAAEARSLMEAIGEGLDNSDQKHRNISRGQRRGSKNPDDLNTSRNFGQGAMNQITQSTITNENNADVKNIIAMEVRKQVAALFNSQQNVVPLAAVDQNVSEESHSPVGSDELPTVPKIDNRNISKGRKHSVTNSKKDRITWVYHAQFSVDQSHWSRLRTSETIDSTYPEYFIPILNNKNIGCVLKSRGPYLSKLTGLFTLRFECTNKPCQRQYKVFEIGKAKFKVYRNDIQPVHVTKKCRQIRSVKRVIVTKALQKLTPSDYLMFCNNGISETLYNEGNLQDCVSTKTVNKIHSEAVQLTDFDKDDVVDLLKMKVLADEQHKVKDSATDVFIRRISLDPFAVLMYGNDQLKLMNSLGERDENLPLHFDATGSLVRHSGKRIYYYAGIVRVKDKPDDEAEKARLQPLIEFVSGEHDSFNIRLKLEEIKKDYETRFPNRKWPIKYVVTDFSFAFLNAFSRGWNSMKLIEYINFAYTSSVNGEGIKFLVDVCRVKSFLQLCCGHFSKTFSRDVSKFFPNMKRDGQKILKEVFAGMIDMNKLSELRTVWASLSTLFFSKYVTQDVEDALETLVRVMAPEHNDVEVMDVEETEDPDENVEWKIQNDINELEAIYKQSLYYQDFSSASYKPSFVLSNAKNEFYSVEFGNVFLKKYVSILCLWTCLIVDRRRSSGPAESHFNCTKKRVKQRVTQIGSVPLKCGRFCRELEMYTKSTTHACLLKIPRNNNCFTPNRKRQRIDDEEQQLAKRIKIDASKHIMDVYRAAPKPKTPKSLTTPNSCKLPRFMSTPKGTRNSVVKQKLDMDSVNEYGEEQQMDNENATEVWYRQRKVVFSHKTKSTLNGLQRADSTKLRSLLVKPETTRKSIDEVTTMKMKNFLFNDPEWHIKPTINYIVARMGRKSIDKANYLTLFGDFTMSEELFNILVSQLQFQNQSFQIEPHIDLNKPKKITKKIILMLMPEKILAANTTRLSFSCFDTKTCSKEKSLALFIDYLKRHNVKFPKSFVQEDGWKIEDKQYPFMQSNQDPALWSLCCIKNYIEKRNFDEFQPQIFKEELKLWILTNSSTMKSRCVVCGLTNETTSSSTTQMIDWVDCLNCERSTHLECINKTIDEVKQSTYLCIVCGANMVETSVENSPGSNNTYDLTSDLGGFVSDDSANGTTTQVIRL